MSDFLLERSILPFLSRWIYFFEILLSITPIKLNLFEPLIRPWAVLADLVLNLPSVNTIALPLIFIILS